MSAFSSASFSTSAFSVTAFDFDAVSAPSLKRGFEPEMDRKILADDEEIMSFAAAFITMTEH